jgi:hypothetical protein
MAQESIEVGDRAAVSDLVQVVEDQHDRLGELIERVDQLRQDAVDAVGRVHRDRGDRLRGSAAGKRLEHAAPEPVSVDVGGVERQPAERACGGSLRRPCARHRALAGAGRCRQQRQRALQAPLERLDEAWALHPPDWRTWGRELRRGERVGGMSSSHGSGEPGCRGEIVLCPAPCPPRMCRGCGSRDHPGRVMRHHPAGVNVTPGGSGGHADASIAYTTASR